MNYLRQLVAKNELKKKGNFFFISLISIFFSLSFYYRFLQISRAGNIERIIVLICLFSFFEIILLDLLPLIGERLFSNQYRFFILGGSLVLVIILFLLLPYRFAPFRTVHTLQVSVPQTSRSVILEKITNDDGHLVSLINGETIQKPEPKVILPGDRTTFSDDITGGLKVDLYGENLPANVIVSWDGISRSYVLDAQKPSLEIRTDPSSWGNPDKKHIFLAVINCISDGVSLLLLFVVLAQIVMDLRRNHWLSQKKNENQNSSFHRFIILLQIPVCIFIAVAAGLSKRLEYLYEIGLALSLFLWVIDVLRMYAKKAVIPGILGFLSILVIYINFIYVPKNIYYLGLLISGSILLIWFSCFLRVFWKRTGFIVFMVVLSIVAILANLFGFPQQSQYQVTVLQIQNGGKTYTSLVNSLCPAPSTLLSVAFYKQFDGANFVMSNNIVTHFNIDVARLINLNNLSSATFDNYPDQLTNAQYKNLIGTPHLLPWPNCRSIENGMFYFLDDRNDTLNEYVFYEYRDQDHDDLFILPKDYLKSGLQ